MIRFFFDLGKLTETANKFALSQFFKGTKKGFVLKLEDCTTAVHSAPVHT